MIPRNLERGFIAQHTIGQPQVGLTTQRPVRTEILRQSVDVHPHDHSYHEICVVLGGSALHRVAEGEQKIQRGSVIVVPPGRVHAFCKTAGLRVANVYYIAEWLAAELGLLWQQAGMVPMFFSGVLLPATKVHQCVASSIDNLERDLMDLRAEGERSDPSPVYMRSTLLKIMATITRDGTTAETEHPFGFHPDIWTAISEIERLVKQGDPISLPAVAKVAGVSPDHFSRRFRIATGQSVLHYYQRRRVLHAGLLLLDPRFSITQIALRLGYADGPHLSRIFKRFNGLTPKEYRNTHFATTK